jgi:hypothetical protein
MFNLPDLLPCPDGKGQGSGSSQRQDRGSPDGGYRSEAGGSPLIPEVRTIIDPDPCATAGCAMQDSPLETCRDHRCPHRWRRKEAEDWAGREVRHGLSHQRNGNER